MSDRIRVLCVEADSDAAGLTAAALEREADRIVADAAAGVGGGLDRLGDGGYDCLVSGHRMSDGPGDEFLDGVRAEHPDLPVVLFVEESDAAVAAAAGSDRVHYVRKGEGTDRYALLATRVVDAIRLRRAERAGHYLDAIDDAREGIAVLDEDGRFAYANGAFADRYGYDAGELRGEGWEALCPGDARTDVRREVCRAIDRTGGWRGTMTGMRADGTTLVGAHHVSATDDDRLVWTVRPASDRDEGRSRIEGLHRATRRLMAADSEQEVAELVAQAAEETLDFPINVVRFREGELLVPAVVSDRARRLFGADRPSYEIGEPTAGLAFERGETVVYDDLETLDDDVEHSPGAGMYVPIGEHGVLSVAATEPDAFDRNDVEVAEILAANAEAALDRVARSQRLRERNEQLEELVGVIAHDLRNPLEVAAGRLELARETGETDHFRAAERAHDRMEGLIEDLLRLARQEARATETERVTVAEAVEDAWETVATADATLRVETDATVRADRSRLRELFENLVRNAVEHGGEAVTLAVGGLEDGFYVADDGPGVPPDERDRVFEGGYSTAETGTGFGLAIVRRIVRAHGWTIDLTESEAGGARFEITGVELVE